MKPSKRSCCCSRFCAAGLVASFFSVRCMRSCSYGAENPAQSQRVPSRRQRINDPLLTHVVLYGAFLVLRPLLTAVIARTRCAQAIRLPARHRPHRAVARRGGAERVLEDRVKGREPQRELTEFQRGLERAAKANAVRERARARQERKQGPATKRRIGDHPRREGSARTRD